MPIEGYTDARECAACFFTSKKRETVHPKVWEQHKVWDSVPEGFWMRLVVPVGHILHSGGPTVAMLVCPKCKTARLE